MEIRWMVEENPLSEELTKHETFRMGNFVLFMFNEQWASRPNGQ